MARPPLPLGEHGSISVASKRGAYVARCRVCGFDGVTRHIQESGKSKTAVRLALQDELRAQRGERTEVLRPESRFRDAADVWMGKIRERRADSTADTYASCLKNQVLPSSASCVWSSATSPTSTPSSRAWSGLARSSSSPTGRPSRSRSTRPTPAGWSGPS